MTRVVKFGLGSRLVRVAPFASLLTIAACSGVLGIEDLHEGPAPGGGSGGSATNGGSTGGDLGPSGGSTVTSNGGSAGSVASGGSTSVGNAGDTGMGEAGVGTVGGTTVTGHVIDFWGHKVPAIPVEVGGTLTTTDSQGQFVVDNVPAEYDASLTVHFMGNDGAESYGWVYQGLTRRDPTLQVYAALAPQEANIDVTFANEVQSDTRTLTFALGGVDGSFEDPEEDLTNFETSDDYWRGPTTTQETAHALLWEFDATTSLPTSYVGYSSEVVSLAGTSAQTAINLDVKAITIASGKVGGNVTVATDTARANNVYLRFSSGAKMQLLNDTLGPAAFSYLVPTIANSTVTFAAVEGDPFAGAYGVVHKDGLAAGNTTLNVTIPAPSIPVAPADGASGVAVNTPFSLLPGTGATGPFVVLMFAEESNDGIFIVTANKQFKLPEVAGGTYGLQSAEHYDWRVETHGSFASVDAMTGPSGFMDEFSGHDAELEPYGEPKGPHNADGSYTISTSNRFATP